MNGRLICCLTLLIISIRAEAQTAFDSLKRNSNLDTTYQPSKKPMITTQNGELRLSGFLQPAMYLDNNNFFDNDLFVTSDIPTTKITDEKFTRFHLSANQSRLGFSFLFPKAKNPTSAFLEADFFSSKQSSTSYFRLRHAYVNFKGFTFGQTWTNFGDVDNAPNTLDLEGPNSMPATRVAQVRWKYDLDKKLQLVFAIEEPKSDYTPLDSAVPVKAAVPEFVAKTNYRNKDITWVSSAVYRLIVYTDKEYSFKKRINCWGISSSVTFKIPERTMLNPFGISKRVINLFAIMGAGTQGSINDFGGLGFEAFPKDSVTLASPTYFGGYAAYSFVWNKRWSSTYVASYLHQQQPPGYVDAFKQSVYFAANAIYAINNYFTIGAEGLYGVKENYDESQGNAFRIMGLMRLIF